MGAVYQAQDLKYQRVCAIKEMSLSMVPSSERPQAIQNFKGEAKILASLSHPNLPSFTNFFTEESRYFIVMEYINGYTLEDILDRTENSLSEQRVLEWAEQLCDVLEYLHNQRPPIIFRDMKPGNIMLTRNGCIKLIDFGIARFFRRKSPHPHDTQLLGTPGFAPIEQYGKAQTDERSDIYSLAMTLFQLLTEAPPQKSFGLHNVRVSYPHISPHVAYALEKATARAPQDRYQNVAAFREALFRTDIVLPEDEDDVSTEENEEAFLKSRGDSEDVIKYGQPKGLSYERWDPLQISPRQRRWQQQGLTCSAAFMAESFLYLVLSHTVFLSQRSLLSSNPSFILVLLGIVPATTIGGLLTCWEDGNIANRTCTGLSIAFIALVPSQFLGQHSLYLTFPPLQVLTTFLITAVGATVGTNATASANIIQLVQKALSRTHWLSIVLMILIAGSLGFFVTLGFPLSWLTPCGIMLGISIAIALILRADHQIRHHYE